MTEQGINVVDDEATDDGEEVSFDSVESLIDFEMDCMADADASVEEARDMSEVAHEAYLALTDEAGEALIERARQVIKAVNPELYEEIKDEEIVIGHRSIHDGSFEFDVCNLDEDEDDDSEDENEENDEGNHVHSTVVRLPDSVLVLSDEDFTKFLGMAEFLDRNSILVTVVRDHCSNCGVLLTDDDAKDSDQQ